MAVMARYLCCLPCGKTVNSLKTTDQINVLVAQLRHRDSVLNNGV